MNKNSIERIVPIQHGFKEIEEEAKKFVSQHTLEDCLAYGKELYHSEYRQVRMMSTFIFGFIASRSVEALSFLKQRVSLDEDWRVQEILAKSFDTYCRDIGYEQAMPIIQEWLRDTNPNVRRAVTEGLRIWTSRIYFKQNPELAIHLLANLKNDQSEYVRKSVGNALRDISKKHKQLVWDELQTWNLSDKQIIQVHQLASKFIHQKL